MSPDEQLYALDSLLSQHNLQTLFQPVFSIAQRDLHGYEALSRGPADSYLHTPQALFETAQRAGRRTELERACRHAACLRFHEMNLPGKLFLNVSPEALLAPKQSSGSTLALMHSLGIPAHRVVIELTEDMPTGNTAMLAGALACYRSQGFAIALDDLGAGYSSLKLWSELRPEYVKIDRHFIDGIHHDSVKREFVGAILNMAKASRARVIAEGIEQPEELQTLADMGIDLVQGYLLSHPLPAPSHTPDFMSVGAA